MRVYAPRVIALIAIVAIVVIATIAVVALLLISRNARAANDDQARVLLAAHELWATVFRPDTPAESPSDLEDRIRAALEARIPVEPPADPDWLDTYDPDEPPTHATTGGLRPGEPIHPDLPRQDPPFHL